MKIDIAILFLAVLALATSSCNAGVGAPPGYTVPPASDLEDNMVMTGMLNNAVQAANGHFPVRDGQLTSLQIWPNHPAFGHALTEQLRHPGVRLVRLGQDSQYTLFGIPWRLHRPGHPGNQRDAVMVFRLHSQGGVWPIGFADFRHQSVGDRTQTFWNEVRDRSALLTPEHMQREFVFPP